MCSQFTYSANFAMVIVHIVEIAYPSGSDEWAVILKIIVCMYKVDAGIMSQTVLWVHTQL